MLFGLFQAFQAFGMGLKDLCKKALPRRLFK